MPQKRKFHRDLCGTLSDTLLGPHRSKKLKGIYLQMTAGYEVKFFWFFKEKKKKIVFNFIPDIQIIDPIVRAPFSSFTVTSQPRSIESYEKWCYDLSSIYFDRINVERLWIVPVYSFTSYFENKLRIKIDFLNFWKVTY